jgi:uncharacterized membrane protein YdcZ (DUF606 family)
MITITILIVLWFVYSVCNTNIKLGSWDDLENQKVPMFIYLGVTCGFVYILITILLAPIFGFAKIGLIP